MEENLRFKIQVLEVDLLDIRDLAEDKSDVAFNVMQEIVLRIDSLRTTVQSDNELRQQIGRLRDELEEESRKLLLQADEHPEQKSELFAREASLGHALRVLYSYQITALDYYYLGCKWLGEGKYQKALEAFQKSISIDEHAKTYERLASTLNTIGQHEGALTAISNAYELNPKNSKTATQFAEMLIQHQKQEDAIIVLKAILNRQSTYGPAKRLLKQIENE